MRRAIFFWMGWTILAVTASADEGWRPLFDGESLAGWTQRGGAAKYRAENGEIIGTSVPNTGNSFLCTDRDYADFILELEFKVHPKLNSGVQIRSLCYDEPREQEHQGKALKFPAGRVHGYQVEIDPSDRAYSGGVYDEGRRGWLADLKDNESARKAFKPEEWNAFRIECRGDSIKTSINGVAATDFRDAMTPSGFIALQVHGVGKNPEPMEVRWRNIRIQELPAAPRAMIDGQGPGWKTLGESDFVNVNCEPDTWNWKDGGVHCTGKPIGVARTKEQYTNFEMVAEWRHLKSAGNSGIFLWATEDGLADLKPNQLPKAGIELQVLDHGFTENYEKQSKKKADWFTTHGDVFPVGKSKMTPFPPASPNGSRSFPSKRLSRGVNEWNHYYVRALNGEVRLWVNGEEVSGGTGCDPRSGYICLESEGSPVEFRNLRIRVLP